MKKILSLLIFIAALTTKPASANDSYESERKITITDRDRWDRGERTLTGYPISATIVDESVIVINFLQTCNSSVLIQIIDSEGNIIYNNVYSPNITISIDIESLTSGDYELSYTSSTCNLYGYFEVY